MAIIKFLYDNLWDASGTTLTSNSEATGYPDTNTQHRWHTRCWRSTSDTAEWLKVDLGSAQNIKAFVVKNHNLTGSATLTIQGNASDAWGTPSVDETLSITDDTVIKLWSANQSYQWWRVYLDDGSNPDTYVKIGRIFLGTYFEPGSDYGSRTVGFIDPSTVKHSTGGQISTNQKTHYKTISYGFPVITDSDVDSFEDVYDEVGQSKNYFICENSADASPYTVTYYVRNTSSWEFPLIEPGMTQKKGTITVETLR